MYEKNTGTLIGFVNLGEINNHLLAFERSLDQDSDVVIGCLAKTVVMFMVQGIFTSLRYPYTHNYFSATITGDLMVQPFWEAVIGLKEWDLRYYFTQAVVL